MNIAKRLKPKKGEYVETPPCAGKVDPTGWLPYYWKRREEQNKRRGRDVLDCQRKSQVEINGVPYCNVHGGEVALSLLLTDQPAQPTPGTPAQTSED